MLNDKVILITGGTGSFGNRFTEHILSNYKPKKVIIYSRDEYKQYVMGQKLAQYTDKVRFFLGDIRDKDRLYRAFDGVDYVVHAAALKQVPALEYNPTEAVKTNVLGADNVVDAAIDRNVEKVIAISTDKAVNPVNLYGASKLVAEKIFVAANAYAGAKVKFSVVRYGNVIGSRGSVVPFFMNLKKQGVKEFPVTDERMTRFWITLDQGVDLVIKALNCSMGGETFIPKIPSMRITDLADAINPGGKIKITGIRPGEKLHEVLVSEDEARNTKIFDGIYVIMPQFFVRASIEEAYKKYPNVPEGFVFQSNVNDNWMSGKELQEIIKTLKID